MGSAGALRTHTRMWTMELERGAGDENAPIASPVLEGVELLFSEEPSAQRIAAETSTLILRRCTALAARARVDLLSAHPRAAAAAELVVLLESMESWSAAVLVSPDPTMTALAAAALQDLRERLQDPESAMLVGRIQGVLEILHSLMEGARIATPA